MTIKEFLESKTFKKIIYGLGAIILILLIFRAGMLVGFRKASFSFGLGNNYYKIFDGPREKFGPPGVPFSRDGLQSGHGVVGSIIQISLPKLVVLGTDGFEKAVFIDGDTVIRKAREVVDPDNLLVSDFVAVIGSPTDDGYIQAKLIRLLPPPPDFRDPYPANR
jgi:hypothetical protein